MSVENRYEAELKAGNDYHAEKDYTRALEEFKRAAELGSIDAQFMIGRYYHSGLGIDTDKAKAIEWLLKASGSGHTEAHTYVGDIYQSGCDGVEANPDLAFASYNAAAMADSIPGQIKLAECYMFGIGVKRDPELAAEWYSKAADRGNSLSQFNLALRYSTGDGLPYDLEKALVWYTRAAENGNVDAQYNLALMYDQGTGTDVNPDQAKYWFERAAEKNHSSAQYALGICYFMEGDSEKGFKAFEAAALQGNTQAQVFVAKCYLNGQGTEVNYEKGLEFLQQAAETDADAQFLLATVYDMGGIVAQDHDEAVKWYGLAASQGHEEAVAKLAQFDNLQQF